MSSEITLVKSAWLDDWYCIVWASHGGRVCDADVEGTSAEMAGIAKALETGEPARHERCAVVRAGLGWDIWSPRNSEKPGRITKKQAAHLAVEIRRVIDVE